MPIERKPMLCSNGVEGNNDSLGNWVRGYSHCIIARKSSCFLLCSEDLGEDEPKDYRQIFLVEEISEQLVTSKLWHSYCFLLLVIYTVRESGKITCNLVRKA